jgi:hypothetical protein
VNTLGTPILGCQIGAICAERCGAVEGEGRFPWCSECTAVDSCVWCTLVHRFWFCSFVFELFSCLTTELIEIEEWHLAGK